MNKYFFSKRESRVKPSYKGVDVLFLRMVGAGVRPELWLSGRY